MKSSGKVGEHGLQLDVLVVVLITMVSHRKSFVELQDEIGHRTAGRAGYRILCLLRKKPSYSEYI